MFNVLDLIKINSDLCPENKRSDGKYQFGQLNYFTVMLDWEFEVVRIFKDDYHGEMAECKVTNQEGIRSNVALRMVDCMLASKSKFKIDYEIVGKVNQHQKEIDNLISEENQLLLKRNTLKQSGMSITHDDLKSNWNEIKSKRVKIKKLLESTDISLHVKHKSGVFEIYNCTEDSIPSKLRTAIRSLRANRKKLSVDLKDIGGGMRIEKVGGVLNRPSKFLELNEKFAMNIIKEHKIPKTQDNYIGIEIEMLAPNKSIEKMNEEFIKARLHRYVNIGTDGSIRQDVDGSKSMELRILVTESQLSSTLRQIFDVLKKNDCYVNRSCGMHVHLDMRNRNPELAYFNLFKVQDLMFNIQPLSRRTNTYCVANKKADLKLSEFGEGERYKAINTTSYNKYNTIEVRLHEGTTKYRDVTNWVNFLVATVSMKEKLSSPISDLNGLKSNYSSLLSDSNIKHFEDRLEEYSA
jgi:hypothetical protein